MALACVCSSELIAPVSVLPKLPSLLPLPVGSTAAAGSWPTPPTEPTLHSLGPSGPMAPEIAGIT